MGRTKEFSKEIEEKVIYNYTVLKKGLQTCGKEFGVSQYMAKKILQKYNVKIRSYTEAKQAGRKYPCNDNFFKKQSSNMAYILGLIASDGYISNKENCISIELQAKDKQILEDISKEMKVTRPLQSQVRKATGNTTCTLRNWSVEWKQDLQKYGIKNKKTFSLKPPTLLLPEYRIDYIRGYFDGDGTICSTKAKNGKNIFYTKNIFEIVGASYDAMKWIYEELINHYGIILNKFSKTQLDNGYFIYKITTTDKKQIQKIYDLFYSSNNLYLKRKKEKFETILK